MWTLYVKGRDDERWLYEDTFYTFAEAEQEGNDLIYSGLILAYTIEREYVAYV